MRLFFDSRQRRHAPKSEYFNGALHPYAEHPGRLDSIIAAIGAIEAPADHGEAPIRAAHDGAYLEFLKSALADWRAAGREGDAIGYTFPIVRRRPLDPDRIDAKLGLYCYDTSTPISDGTWESAYWGAQSALAAVHALLAGERTSFALCRPPGHHAGADYCGGYSYLNNAAIAAQAARDAGISRVAILDIDYHHGNGTQDIFFDRGDVFYASIHADPDSDYPFFWGRADETGAGDGEGTTLNLPLPRGTTIDAFRRAQSQALEAIARFGPGLLLVSFGADTWEGDPISHFRLTTEDYRTLAGDIARAGLPTAIMMEGGYATDALGANVASLLSGF
jgi:acetoin utilization deacetylase AcuC-like enzyme